jgi:hypothetical protein
MACMASDGKGYLDSTVLPPSQPLGSFSLASSESEPRAVGLAAPVRKSEVAESLTSQHELVSGQWSRPSELQSFKFVETLPLSAGVRSTAGDVPELRIPIAIISQFPRRLFICVLRSVSVLFPRFQPFRSKRFTLYRPRLTPLPRGTSTFCLRTKGCARPF